MAIDYTPERKNALQEARNAVHKAIKEIRSMSHKDRTRHFAKISVEAARLTKAFCRPAIIEYPPKRYIG